MPTRPLLSRCLAAVAAAVLATFVLACSGKITQGPPPKQPQPQPQPQPNQPPKVDPFADPVIMVKGVELFDQGKAGEDKYKGQVVRLTGRINLAGTKPAAAGGTTTVTLEGDEGDPPYAVGTVGERSNGLIGVRTYGDVVWGSLVGVYKGRDERGTILLDPANLQSVTTWFDWLRERKDKSPKDKNQKPVEKKDDKTLAKDKNEKPIEKKKEEDKGPVRITAEKLAQEITDDVIKNYPRYYGKPLQITGTL